MNLTWKVYIQLNFNTPYTEHYISTEELLMLIEAEREDLIWKFKVVNVQ